MYDCKYDCNFWNYKNNTPLSTWLFPLSRIRSWQ